MAGEVAMWRKRVIRIGIVFFSIVALLAAAFFVTRGIMIRKWERERAEWKLSALERLARSSITNEEIRRELETLKAGPKPQIDFGWAHDHVLLMTNGQFLIYASRHGFNNGALDHLFLAHGSDGRWFYSTFHFCNNMAMIRGDDPPGSLSEFAKRYFAREFDGKSDECLQHTWPLKK